MQLLSSMHGNDVPSGGNEQHAHRLRFMEAVQAWRALGEEGKARYNKRAKRMGRTGYNLFVGEYAGR
jgi:hypothetical protein